MSEIIAKQFSTVHSLLERSKKEIASALPKHLTADRLARIVMTEVRKNPALLNCEPKSLIGAVMQAAQLGLEPGGALGHCYLIPFNNRTKGITEVSFMLGYKGMLALVRNSGAISHVSCRAVYRGDEFKFSYGLDETLEHRPSEKDMSDADLTHVYAVCYFKDGGRLFEVMTRAQIDAVRKRSKSSNNGPWVSDFEAMARKSAIRRMFKYLPVSIEIQRAIALDEQEEAGISQDNADVFAAEFSAVDEERSEEKPATKIVKSAASKDDSGEVMGAQLDNYKEFMKAGGSAES